LDVPVVNQSEMSYPEYRIVEEPYEVIDEIHVPRERFVDRIIQIPVY
jgi:hypothetical protein